MIRLSAKDLGFVQLNHRVRELKEDIIIEHCFGERFIASGAKDKTIKIYGTPGNALGAYLDGATVEVYGNAQDAVGDTMNDGRIIVHGNAGDTLGYAMRGGKILVKGNSGYRTGIHMKEYKEKKPVIVIGGSAGGFLGEYLAGGVIVVLGLGCEGFPAGHFMACGMHGGKIYIRSDIAPQNITHHVTVSEVSDLSEISEHLEDYCKVFGATMSEITAKKFWRLVPDSKNPYERMYAEN